MSDRAHDGTQGNGTVFDVPLVVDLDGTLTKTDVSFETVINLTRGHLSRLLLLPFWMLQGRSSTKRRLAELSPLDPSALPYNEDLVEYLRGERARGRKIVLATASDRVIAERVAEHLGLFDEVLGSNGLRNLKGPEKAKVLVERYGEGGFSYAGDSGSDLSVWPHAKSAILVRASARVAGKAQKLAPIEKRFERKTSIAWEILREARPHQWLKNLLVFLAPVAGHTILNGEVLRSTLIAFAAFCAAASGIYFINDMLDLETDRKHPRKRSRPLASGDLPVKHGLLGPLLVLAALLIGLVDSVEVCLVVYLYVAVSLFYSQYLKTRPLVDVFCLAVLYTIRLYAGGIASGDGVSMWLLNFSLFLFLALGFLKRYTEFPWSPQQEIKTPAGRRGYQVDDSLLLLIMGVACSFIATVVFALYVDSAAGHKSFKTSYLLWGIVPLVLFWQLRLWLATVRGFMYDDPVLYAAKDNISRVVFLLAGILYVLASTDIHNLLAALLFGQE